MKVLTLTQPWATLVTIGAKRIETRSWRTSYRGPLAIHAAQGFAGLTGPAGFLGRCSSEPFRSALAGAGITHGNQLPRGAIVAVCRLVDCVSTDSVVKQAGAWHRQRNTFWPLTVQERAFGDYSAGRYAWLLADIQALPEPILAKGALGLWEPDAATLEAVQRQIAVTK